MNWITKAGLGCRPQIKAIEIASGKDSQDQYFERLALGVDDLSDVEKEFLKNRDIKGLSCDILSVI